MAKIKEYFSDSELQCSCCGSEEVTPEARLLLNALRCLWGKPLSLSSAYRCENHPVEARKIAKGRKAGRHNVGDAFDIRSSSKTEQLALMKIAMSLGFKGFGFHSSFLHIDLREDFMYWDYD